MRAWIKRGTETDEEPFASFASDVMVARAEDAIRNQAVINAAAEAGDWKAAAWNLERKHSELYGRHSKHGIEANVESQTLVELFEQAEN